MEKEEYAVLSVSRYPGYSHFYGRLDYMGKGQDLSCRLTVAEARLLSEPTYRYKEGDTSERFLSLERLIAVARETLPDCVIALFSSNGVPSRVLWHRDPAKMTAANEIMVEYDKVAVLRSTPNSVLDQFCDRWGEALGIDWREF